MDFYIDDRFRKIITLPLERAVDNAEKYKFLHTKTLYDFNQIESISEIELYKSKDVPVGIVIIFENIFKPNLLFHFSKKFDVEKFNSDDSYNSNCQFFYWEDGAIKDIRFASPHLNFDKTEPLFK